MVFWIIAAVLAAGSTAALLFPLMHARAGAVATEALHDVEVYKDQLKEIDQDLSGGLISAGEADVARAEIGRRLLAASKKAEGETAAASGATAARKPFRIAAAGIVVFMPVATLAAYLTLGSPDLPQQPLSARLAASPEQSEIGILVARAEKQLAANPDDGRGWEVLAPIYMRMSRFDDAANAYRRSIAINGPTSVRQAGLGEALFSAAGGLVTEEAKIAFQTAREMDPEDPKPRFFLAVALSQEGRTEEAIGAFEALKARAPEGTPWLPAVEAQIAALKGTPPALPGTAPGASIASQGRNPTAEDIAAASAMTPDERMDMIRGMVSNLEARLKDNPGDGEGWLRLVRSLSVLGETERAQAALDRAFSVLPAGGQDSRALTELAAGLGLSANLNLGGLPTASPTPPAPVAPGATTGAPGPSATDVEAAGAMSAAERMDMIRSMVASLDEKMRADPSSLDGWMRLIRSYVVIEDLGSAQDALQRALGTFPIDSDGGRQLAALAGELGLTQAENN